LVQSLSTSRDAGLLAPDSQPLLVSNSLSSTVCFGSRTELDNRQSSTDFLPAPSLESLGLGEKLSPVSFDMLQRALMNLEAVQRVTTYSVVIYPVNNGLLVNFAPALLN
jgi:hypothetical protein